VKLKWRPTT